MAAQILESVAPGTIRAITKMCVALRISEPLEETVHTQGEANALYYQLAGEYTRRRELNNVKKTQKTAHALRG